MASTRTLRPRTSPLTGSGRLNANRIRRSGRLTRGTAAAAPASSVTVSRSPPSVKTGSPQSIHLTVKMSSSKLRQVTNSRSSRGASSRHNIFTEEPVVQGKRSSRNTRNLREVSEDDDDDDDEIDEEEEEDEIDDSEDGPGEDDDELDADGDLEMEDDTPQPPVSKRSTRPAAAAAKVKNKAVKSVEEKEMELSRDDEDEELSELDSDADGEPDDTMLQDEEMGEGVEEEGEEEDAEGDEEDGLGSDDDSSSPDLAKLTKRQRGNLGNDFLQLPMGKLVCY